MDTRLSRVTTVSSRGKCQSTLSYAAIRAPRTAEERHQPLDELYAIYLELIDPRNQWNPGIAHRIRRIGKSWSARHESVFPLIEALRGRLADLLASTTPEQETNDEHWFLIRTHEISSRISLELCLGFENSHLVRPARSGTGPGARPAALLSVFLTGTPTPRPVDAGSPGTPQSGYCVVAVRSDGWDKEAAVAALDRLGGPGTVTMLSADGGYALLPAHDDAASRTLCERLHSGLDGSVWLAAGWRRTTELADAKPHVDDILALALALHSEPAVYWLDDFPVEYAAIRTPAVAELLLNLIEPVVSRPLLLLTLEALIGAGGNRSRAAKQLAVHYSTIDYRLRRIEVFTGHSPLSTTGLNLLSTAFAVHVLATRGSGVAPEAAGF
jgi:hypothetical protein